MAKELKQEDLEKVVGGTLTTEAAQWIDAHYDQLMALADEKGMKGDAESALFLANLPFTGTITLETVKSKLSDFIDLDLLDD